MEQELQALISQAQQEQTEFEHAIEAAQREVQQLQQAIAARHVEVLRLQGFIVGVQKSLAVVRPAVQLPLEGNNDAAI